MDGIFHLRAYYRNQYTGDTIDFSNNIDENEKRLLLNQLYFFKGLAYLYTLNQREPYLGKVVDYDKDTIYFSTK